MKTTQVTIWGKKAIMRPKLKRCPKCKKYLSESMFSGNKGKNRRINLQTYCIRCQRKYHRENYAKNRNRIIRKARKNKKKVINRSQRMIFNYIIKHKCVDCGESDPLVLEFDHLEDKDDGIARLLAYGFSWKIIKREIQKCEIRCANCHRKKTHKERNSYRYRLYNKLKLIGRGRIWE